MTQNSSDVEIANQGFAAFRQDLNDVLEDITTLHSGTAAPSTTYANQWWYETDTNKLYIRNEDNDAWIEILTLDQANDHLATLGASITLDGTGNVSIDSGDFTVDTNTLHVDRTNNRVGVGTNSPDSVFHLSSGVADFRIGQIAPSANSAIRISRDDTTVINGNPLGYLEFGGNDSTSNTDAAFAYVSGEASGTHGAGDNPTDLTFGTTADGSSTPAERMRIDSSGNVGIGTSSPAARLSIVDGTSSDQLRIGSSTSYYKIGRNSSTGLLDFNGNQSGFNGYVFGGANGERLRIDSSGNVFTAKASASRTTVGHELHASGLARHTAASDKSLEIVRTGSDGEMVEFFNDSVLAGSIGSPDSTTIYVSSSVAGGLRFTYNAGYPVIAPCTTTGSNLDNSGVLGFSSIRFADAYITNGVTTGSDQNEKQQIASLTDAEIAAAKRISNGFKTFKWNDAVEEKGDNARTHTGVIAQEVRTALEAEGLDAGDYAFFMSNTWWETQTDVPAVEAVEAQDAVYDEDGNVVTEAVEAVEARDAYTRTDTYDTAEEAPAGATERTRLGIRYPELLAFVGAATEQRMADLETAKADFETRIAALESA